MATQPAERITANDEERQRQGFELQTTFEWAVREYELDVRRVSTSDRNGEIVRLAYGAGATITRLNKGLRRRANRAVLGFRIDPVSGYWAKNEDEDDDAQTPTTAAPQWIVPSVQDRKNALRFEPIGESLSAVTLATVQHAILRGLEAVFQLEESEILAEPMPTRDTRHGFLLYEATEGGAGVLTRFVAEENTIARVARQALEVMHFAVDEAGPLPSDESKLKDQSGVACVAACYRCLMSYYNQPDHELIDRRDAAARTILLRLAGSTTKAIEPSHHEALMEPGSDSAYDLWFREATRRKIPAPDPEPIGANGHSVRLVWRRCYVAAVVNGADAARVKYLEDLSFEVIPFGNPAAWNESFARLAVALGRGS